MGGSGDFLQREFTQKIKFL